MTSKAKCRRYMDDYPGVRAECERNIAAGRLCYDCPKQPNSKESLASRLKASEALLRQVTDDRDAKTKRMWQLGHELEASEARCRELHEACDAAETILRVTPDVSTNARGTKPNMTTALALEMVRACLARERSDG